MLYLSTVIDPTSRLTFMSGISNSTYQIPNNPGQTPTFTAFGVSNFNSALLNEHQNEFNQFNVLAYQKSVDGYRLSRSPISTATASCTSYPTRSAIWSSTASRRTFTVRASSTAFRTIPPGASAIAHTLRFGFSVSAERSLVNNTSTVLPFADPDDPSPAPIDAPFSVFDSSAKTGWLFGTYLQDEWRITNNLTLNAGLRFDQMYQYVDANQLSPRASLTWKPYDGTTFHAGYARNFTPPRRCWRRRPISRWSCRAPPQQTRR